MSGVPEDATTLAPLLERLKRQAVCTRCSSIACDREGAGELHDHVCTEGEGCVETREKLQKRVRGLRYLCAEAARALAARPAVRPEPLAREDMIREARLDAIDECLAALSYAGVVNGCDVLRARMGAMNPAERQRSRATTGEAKHSTEGNYVTNVERYPG